MAPRIVLVRHGRSAHAPGGWMDVQGMRRWFDDYDRAGIADDDAPPAPLRELAERAGLVVASDLPRAQMSAERLAPGQPVVVSPLLREVPIVLPELGTIRMPIAAWALATGVRHAVARVRGTPAPAEARKQARHAAEWLAGLADRHEEVLVVTHANLRGLLSDVLVGAGWEREPGGARLAHWSAWTFVRGANARMTGSWVARR